MTVRFTLPFLLLLTACSNCSPAGPEKPIDYRDTPQPTDSDSCEAAEKHLTDLCQLNPAENHYCCEAVAPTKKGKSFGEFCHETQDNGIARNPKCLSTVKLCGQIDECVGTVLDSGIAKDGGAQ